MPGAQTAITASAAQQRNAPCSCGSGMRYKHCCGRADAPTKPGPAAAPPYGGWESFDAAEQAALWRTMQEALAAQKKGQFDIAARGYESVLERAPLTFDAVHMLGVVRMEQGALEHAEALLTRALDLMPGLEAIRQNLRLLEHRKREHEGLHSARTVIAYDALRLHGYEQRHRRASIDKAGFPLSDIDDDAAVVHVVIPGDPSNAGANRDGVALFKRVLDTHTTLLWTNAGQARSLASDALADARAIDPASDLMPHSGTLVLFGLCAPMLAWLPRVADRFDSIAVGVDVHEPTLYLELLAMLSPKMRDRVRIVARSREALQELGLPGAFDPMLFETIRPLHDARVVSARRRIGVFMPTARDGYDAERWQMLEWLRRQQVFLRLLYPGRLPSPHVESDEEHLVSLVSDWDGWRRSLEGLFFWGAGGRMRQYDRLVFEAAEANLGIAADGFGDYASAIEERPDCRMFFGVRDARIAALALLASDSPHPRE